MDLIQIYQCFCDRTRLRILNLLAQGPLCVCHFQEILGEPQVKISKHLGYLKEREIVVAERRTELDDLFPAGETRAGTRSEFEVPARLCAKRSGLQTRSQGAGKTSVGLLRTGRVGFCKRSARRSNLDAETAFIGRGCSGASVKRLHGSAHQSGASQKARRGEAGGLCVNLTALLSRLMEWEQIRPGRRSSGRRR